MSNLEGAAPRLPAFLLGIGLGGFIDGIVLHQLLQWHHLLTDTEGNPATTLQGLEANTVADGLFHAATWLVVLAGVTLTMRAWQVGELAPPWRVHVGMLLTGWGVFNVTEGVISHQLLGLHHVRDDLGAPLAWDVGFLALGALLTAGGLAIAGRRPRGMVSEPATSVASAGAPAPEEPARAQRVSSLGG